MGMRRGEAALAVCVVGMIAAGCTPTPPSAESPGAPSPESTPAAQASAMPSPWFTRAAQVPAWPIETDFSAPGDSDPCRGARFPEIVSDPSQIEQLGGATLAVPFDRGPMPHASGETVVDAAGVPVAYIVAENDVFSTVGARLCVGEQWLRWVNYARRDGDALYVGDTLNIDAHTIFSVGDQNGAVFEREFPEGFVLPPQR